MECYSSLGRDAQQLGVPKGVHKPCTPLPRPAIFAVPIPRFSTYRRFARMPFVRLFFVCLFTLSVGLSRVDSGGTPGGFSTDGGGGGGGGGGVGPQQSVPHGVSLSLPVADPAPAGSPDPSSLTVLQPANNNQNSGTVYAAAASTVLPGFTTHYGTTGKSKSSGSQTKCSRVCSSDRHTIVNEKKQAVAFCLSRFQRIKRVVFYSIFIKRFKPFGFCFVLLTLVCAHCIIVFLFCQFISKAFVKNTFIPNDSVPGQDIFWEITF